MYKLICLLLPLIFSNGIYDYSLPSAQGGIINLNDYRGKKILIVNTASNSEKAVQYAKLEELYQQYKNSLVVIAVPSNSFGNEQDNDSALYEHITIQYGATYPVAGKADVAGDSTCGLYQWLSLRALNGVMDNDIHTDFRKFLVDGSGRLIGAFTSSVDPLSPELQQAINGAE